ncbi:MFS transporter [Burkholderia ubonensis]|uniref:MFS transporter n=1 Tax=Burkholderia ubonensis TaxID=101571 RepID=UPI0009B37D89
MPGAAVFYCAPLVAHWSDRYGRVRVMAAPAVGILVLIHPAFAYPVAHPGFGTLIAVQIVFAFLMTGYFAGLPALLSEVFPVQTRTTGMSLAYNVGVTIFGGFGPFIIAWLIRAAGMKTAPSFYVMFAAVLSLAALAVLRRRFGFR